MLWIFEFIFGAGYKTTSNDEQYLNALIKDHEQFGGTAFENFCMALCFSKVKQGGDFKKIREKHREIYVLVSGKFKRIIGSSLVISCRLPTMRSTISSVMETYLSVHLGDMAINELDSKPFYQKRWKD